MKTTVGKRDPWVDFGRESGMYFSQCKALAAAQKRKPSARLGRCQLVLEVALVVQAYREAA